MSEDTPTLAELMFHAEQFCDRTESALRKHASLLVADESQEARLKIGDVETFSRVFSPLSTRISSTLRMVLFEPISISS